MCGIAGIVAADRSEDAALRVAAMVEMLAHRGPDDRGIHIEPGAALGHTRLSVIDGPGGAQPMSVPPRGAEAASSGALWITFNGEIFNYVELREELTQRGHRFRTQSDTEVLLRLYQEMGPRCVDRLNGQWA